MGILRVSVKYKDQRLNLELFVLPSYSNTPIIGRQWLRKLNMIKINNDRAEGNLFTINSLWDINEWLLKEFKSGFQGKLGTYKDGQFSLLLKRNAVPIFHKLRPVPFAMCKMLETELNRLVRENIIEPVNSSDWATPIIPVIKSNGEIRPCRDYKININPQFVVDRYPIPRVADLVNKLQGGTVFSKLDLVHAYQ